MRDNLIFKGIPEKKDENPEAVIRNFMQKEMKMTSEQVNKISVARAHRMGWKNEQNNYPCVIVAKFDFFKQKEEIKWKSKELKGSKFYVSDQFPKEILDRRKKLYPIVNENWKLDRGVTLVLDRLYIEGQLYINQEVTPWLY
ncbi:hypothetical protein AAFF_G00337210 [Aldrovandia affinis]|uniref:Uncharacterized protein n=1 Tax=Aldrovandia affinis TaxID=143900 RepID=A0AAD7SKU4_9TELE|nr:hypothetical protein AAFF_G00337210 [Aldrovandia affinis]